MYVTCTIHFIRLHYQHIAVATSAVRHTCQTCDLARHVCLGSLMVRVFCRPSEGCWFDSHYGL